ncbi:MAG: hypothetical protein KA198_08225 [Chitinophagaceae bacterium]|nr:hypothetical protein [Chitinophagaceae bacterium]
MRKLIFICLLFLSLTVDAQRFYRRSEFGIAGGAANYYGDINPNFGMKGLGYNGGLFYKYNFSKYIALRLGGNYAKIGSQDKYSSNYFQQQRNLSFKSSIYEVGLNAEFSFFQYRLQDFEYRFTPYVTIGFNMFWYNPYTEYEGKRYYLRPLGTEGQKYEEYKDRRYSNHAYALPIGAGFKFWVTKGITFNMEVVHRYTTTDYLDDVSRSYVGKDKFNDIEPSPYPSVSSVLQDRSPEVTANPIGVEGRQRGISSTKDQYLMMQIGISFRLPTYKCPDDL